MLKKTKTTWGHIGDEYKYNLSFKEKDELTEKDFYDLDITIQENDLRDHLQSHEHDFEPPTPLSKSVLQHSLSTLKTFYKEWATHYKELREIVEMGMKSGKLSEHVMKYIDGKPECRSIAMKRMMQISVESSDSSRASCMDAIVDLMSKYEVDKVYLRRALDIIYSNIADIAIDSPYIIYYLKRMWVHFLKNKIIYPNFLMRIPPDIMQLSSIASGIKDCVPLQAYKIIYTIDELKNDVLNIIKEVFATKNYTRLIEFITHNSDPLFHPIILKAGLLHALEAPDSEKIEYCDLLQFMKTQAKAKYWAFTHVFDDIICLAENYEPDFPNYISDVCKFAMAALQINALPSSYIICPDQVNYDSPLSYKILKRLIKELIANPHADYHEFWVKANSISEIKECFDKIIASYLNEKDELQVAQYLRKLNCPTYLGEFIKRLVTNYIEKNPSKEPKFDVIHKIINYLKVQDIIAQDDVIDGISKVTKRLEDISLDCPYFKEQFDILSKELIKC